KGVYDDNYRTTTGKNHPYTEPDYEDPYELIERIVLQQEKRFVTKQQEHLNSGEDVYAVITGDWHAPDRDPAVMELGMQIAGDWTAGAVNALCVYLGDYTCYPTLLSKNKYPSAIPLASTECLGNIGLQTTQGAVQLRRDWREIIPDWCLLEGN